MAKKIQVRLIMQLRDTGMAQTTIASERHMSKTSVSEVFQIAEDQKLHYADVEDMTPDETYRFFFPDRHIEETVYTVPDYGYMHNELPKDGCHAQEALEGIQGQMQAVWRHSLRLYEVLQRLWGACDLP